ncbi:CopD family protein [Scleromatobacter humisilvae]|uniref:Protoporphyrinogen IX oxidase n=1 Tax=Scleromatobacter humisilvae TaxID=2897159 RepID=A0A9X1YJ37_9BURK|nr:CopD family protein [Scleromatobacter humisilvae]MCK9687254.1 CopD family protein [Scleromatobacter humisilvae]
MDAATRYDLVRVLHIGADIVFVAGLLAGALVLAALSFQAAPALIKERRLVAAMLRINRVVTGSALLLAWACGLWLAWQAGWFASGWLHVKLVLVLALSALHGGLSAALRRAGADAPRVPARAWRAAPALALAGVAGVVWLALGKPF